MRIRVRKAGFIGTDLYKQINIICKLPKKICIIHIKLEKQYKRITQGYIKNRLENGLFCLFHHNNENFFYEDVIFQELEIDENIVRKYLQKYYFSTVLENGNVEIGQVKFIEEEPCYDA